MVSLAELISKGYHSLVPGLISISLETVWVPLKMYFYGIYRLSNAKYWQDNEAADLILGLKHSEKLKLTYNIFT